MVSEAFGKQEKCFGNCGYDVPFDVFGPRWKPHTRWDVIAKMGQSRGGGGWHTGKIVQHMTDMTECSALTATLHNNHLAVGCNAQVR